MDKSAASRYTLYSPSGKKVTVTGSNYDRYISNGYTTSKPKTTTSSPSTKTTSTTSNKTTSTPQVNTTSVGDIATQDLEQLLSYKNAYGSATDDAGRLAASSAADALRDKLGLNQGSATSIGGTNVGAMSAAELQALIDSRDVRDYTTHKAPSPAITATQPTYRPADEQSEVTQITIDPDIYKGVYTDAVQGMYDLLGQRQGQNEQAYQRGLGQLQDTLIDTIGLESRGAIASGASKGMQGAQALSALLGFGQQGVEGVTGLAEERANLSLEEASAMAEAEKLAFNDSEAAKQALASLTNELYGYDSANYAAELGLNSNYITSLFGKEAQQIANEGQIGAANIAAQAQVDAAKAYTSTAGVPADNDTDGWSKVYTDWTSFSKELQTAIQIAERAPSDEANARRDELLIAHYGTQDIPGPFRDDEGGGTDLPLPNGLEFLYDVIMPGATDFVIDGLSTTYKNGDMSPDGLWKYNEARKEWVKNNGVRSNVRPW